MDDLIKRTLLRLRGEYMDDEADAIEALQAERDVALAKLEALEKQEPFAHYNEGIEYHTRGKIDFHKEPTVNLETRWWTEDKPLYASPVLAQPEPVASLYISANGEREIDDWKCELPAGRHVLYTALAAAKGGV